MTYAREMHDVEFFDIENNEFVTPEGRRINSDKLSQGQNKNTALTPTLKRLGLDKNKMEKLPNSLGNLIKLRKIYLMNNPPKHTPKDTTDPPKLQIPK